MTQMFHSPAISLHQSWGTAVLICSLAFLEILFTPSRMDSHIHASVTAEDKLLFLKVSVYFFHHSP